MNRNLFLVVFIALSMPSCNHTDASEFEKASGMAIPADAVEKESYDDGKLVKINSYRSDSDELSKYVKANAFGRFSTSNLPQFWGSVYLKEKPDLANIDFFYYKNGVSGKVSWIYIVDLKSNTLWTELKYPGKPSY